VFATDLVRMIHYTFTHFYLVPRFRMSGAVPLIPLYAFMAWTRKIYVLHHTYIRTYISWKCKLFKFVNVHLGIFKV
jgi:hypothetical protein